MEPTGLRAALAWTGSVRPAPGAGLSAGTTTELPPSEMGGTGQDTPELPLSPRHREPLHTCVWGPELWVWGMRCTAGIRATSQGVSGAREGTEGWTWGAGPGTRGQGEGVEPVKTDNSEQFCC